MENNVDIKRKDPIFNIHQESIKGMVDHIYLDIRELFDSQNLLMRKEIKEKIDSAKMALGSFLVGGILLAMGLMGATVTGMIALSLVLPLWASGVIVTLFLFTLGGFMIVAAKKKLTSDNLIPHQSLEKIGEIKSAFKDRFNEFNHH